MLIKLVLIGAIAALAYFLYQDNKNKNNPYWLAPSSNPTIHTLYDANGKLIVQEDISLPSNLPNPYPPAGTYGPGPFAGYSPYNLYGVGVADIPVDAKEIKPATVYYYASDRVPDFLLSADERVRLQQTRQAQTMWPASKARFPLVSTFGTDTAQNIYNMNFLA